MEDFELDKMSLNEVSGALRSAAKQYKIFKKGVEAADYLANFEQVINNLKIDQSKIEKEIEYLYKKYEEARNLQDQLLLKKKKQITKLDKLAEEMQKTAIKKREEAKKEVGYIVDSVKAKVNIVKDELNVLENANTVLRNENTELETYKNKLSAAIKLLKKKFD